MPPQPPADEAALVAQALRERPDVVGERLRARIGGEVRRCRTRALVSDDLGDRRGRRRAVPSGGDQLAVFGGRRQRHASR